jgi:o-succinylbenzoate synthase
VRLETRLIRAPLRAPFVAAAGTLRVRELLLVTLTDTDGAVGYGECAPLEPYVRGTLSDCMAALEDCREALARGGSLAELRAECARVAVLLPAIAAVDLALWDLEARRAGVPVWQLLGAPLDRGRPGDEIGVNATIAAADRAGAARAAGAAREAGFECVKVKVGLGDDAGRLAAVRAAAGPSMAIRVDANGAWTVQEAVASLRALAPVGLELCEEPVNGLDELERVAAAVPVPVALDETAALPGALDRAVAAAVCLKIASGGGLTRLLDAAARARRAGYDVYLASTLDGPFGIAAALHACAVLRPDRPCGLATLALFDGHDDPLPAISGRIRVPVGPGLGAGLLGWYG